jgi:hypothetical protein
MNSVVDILMAEGEAIGVAKGAVVAVLDLVADGTLTGAQAKAKFRDLKKKGLLDAATHKTALAKLKAVQ